MTVTDILGRLAAGQVIPGRHLVLVAHPDDEVISATALLNALDDVILVQLTQDTDAREQERRAAHQAAGWSFPVRIGGMPFRQAHCASGRLQALVDHLVQNRHVDVIWTHPYEGGHLDHDTAAWISQQVNRPCRRFEFASYHATASGQAFGTFWTDPRVETIGMRLPPALLARKLAALAAYASQAHILRKFPTPEVECYREAPVYDFSKPAPPPRSRWDLKGYQPSTAVWRDIMGRVAA